MNKIQGDRQYLNYWRYYLDTYGKDIEICSSKIPGKYCIEFRNFKPFEFFNSLETSKKLMDCEYYPPSIIVKKERDWDILELEENEFFNCYPKYYDTTEISVCQGKNFIYNSKPNFPFLVQDKIETLKEEHIFILYLKKENIISAYYAPVNIENKENLLNCLCNIQKFIIPKFDSKNYSENEYLLTKYDIIEDINNKFWLKGIHWDPQFGVDFVSTLKNIVEDIFHHINYSEFNYFLPLEKLFHTHVSNSSL